MIDDVTLKKKKKFAGPFGTGTCSALSQEVPLFPLCNFLPWSADPQTDEMEMILIDFCSPLPCTPHTFVQDAMASL